MIYFIHCPGRNAVKIGVATDPMKRLQTLQTGCPDTLAMLGQIDGGVPEEKALHRRFEPLRIRGEWFRATDQLLAAIEVMINPVPKLNGTAIRSVYLAGRFGANNWRRQIMPGWSEYYSGHNETGQAENDADWSEYPSTVSLPDGRTIQYAGPYWINMGRQSGHACQSGHARAVGDHGYGEEYHGEIDTDRDKVLACCTAAVRRSDLVFAWLDSRECFGTLVEIGYYRRAEGGVLVVAMPRWDRELWFAAHLADFVIIAHSAAEAWRKLWSDPSRKGRFDPNDILSESEGDGLCWACSNQLPDGWDGMYCASCAVEYGCCSRCGSDEIAHGFCGLCMAPDEPGGSEEETAEFDGFEEHENPFVAAVIGD